MPNFVKMRDPKTGRDFWCKFPESKLCGDCRRQREGGGRRGGEESLDR